ncbi:hypothetical protein IJH02_02525 [Candidatus Saccharibacteria bacterium]|nr:hypothetical protein [Candidatus Saccharibacteria bacterium]
MRVQLEPPPEGVKNPEDFEEEPLKFVGTEAYNFVSEIGDRVGVSVLRSYDKKRRLLKIRYGLKSPAD